MGDLQNILIMAGVVVASFFGISSKLKQNKNVKRAKEALKVAEKKAEEAEKNLRESSEKTDQAISAAKDTLEVVQVDQDTLDNEATSRLDNLVQEQELAKERQDVISKLSEGVDKDALELEEAKKLLALEAKMNEES